MPKRIQTNVWPILRHVERPSRRNKWGKTPYRLNAWRNFWEFGAYRAGPKALDFRHVENDRCLKQEVIKPATTEWAAPIVSALKKDGILCIFVGYRRLNAVTKRVSYPILRMNKRMHSLGESTGFCTSDAHSGHWLLKIDDRDNNTTIFTFHHGLY